MLPRPNDKTRLCLDTKCAKRETCWRYVRGGNITVGEFFDHEWIETCNKARAVLRAAEFVQAGLDA